MTTMNIDTLAVDAIAELLGGVSSAMPGPLFLVDAAGRAHALNDFARDFPSDHGAAEAFMSPVHLGTESAGHVVGYVREGAPERDAPLTAALVALAARVVNRRLEGATDDFPELPEARITPVRPDEILDDARRLLGQVVSEQAAAEIVASAAHAALGARSVVLFTTTQGRTLEPVARRGSNGLDARSVRLGQGFLGWAAERAGVTSVRNLAALPADAPRCSSGRCTLSSWLEPPFAIVPIRVGPELMGVLCVAGLPRRPGVDVSAAAAGQLERLADKAAACLAGARMLSEVKKQERTAREMEIARQIQRSLLPHGSLEFQGLELEGECRPASQVGGDYFGFRAQADLLTTMVFDVAGHGVGAAFCMTLVRSALNAELARGGSLPEVLARANNLAWEDLSESALHATAFLARFDRERGVLEHASAGHARPILWSAQDRAFRDLNEGGKPLGMFADEAFAGGEVPFGPGDVLVLYTDGIVEAENAAGEEFGRQRMLSAVKRARRRSGREVLRRLWRELAAFVGDRPMRDDATLVVVRGGEAFGRVIRPRPRARARHVASRPAGACAGAAGSRPE
jgi:serine phosphatase RsbU (regulator of sigma subunit)